MTAEVCQYCQATNPDPVKYPFRTHFKLPTNTIWLSFKKGMFKDKSAYFQCVKCGMDGIIELGFGVGDGLPIPRANLTTKWNMELFATVLLGAKCGVRQCDPSYSICQIHLRLSPYLGHGDTCPGQNWGILRHQRRI